MDDRKVSRLPLIAFSLVTALAAVALYFFVRQTVGEAQRARLLERDRRLVQIFQDRILSRLGAVRVRVEGAELLIAATPPSARTAARALAFALREDSEEGYLAAVVLDERGAIIASRRKGSVPPPGEAEKAAWIRGAEALQKADALKKPPDGRHYLEAGALSGVPVIYFVGPSPSTKGFWGVILASESLLPVEPAEAGARDAVFLLAGDEQSVIYARQGPRFLHQEVGRPFDRGLASALDIVACCEPAAFNTVNEGDRWMVQSRFTAGARDFLLVRVADRREAGAGQSSTERLLIGTLAAGWILLVGIFGFAQGRRAPAPEPLAGGEEAFPAGRPAAGPEGIAPSALFGLNRVSEAVARGDHFRDVIALAAQETARFIRADRHYAALYDDSLNQVLEVASSQLGEGYRAAVGMGVADLPEWIAIRERDIVEVTSLDGWQDAPEAFRSEGSKAAAVFPIRIQDRVFGLLSFFFNEPRELEGREVEFCSLAALQCASAVARALSLAEPPPRGAEVH
ncbi:MAG: GAF domain-containing protein [Candidatus Tectomicrobia bacterium]|uniref:GAF domain-containing protein n=1 Tax=Tectimicrobiota bacterium TaxID=2528274 RepID=A0A932MMQ7_UNCTE|nr:GAF domain-containing protein [Candidatus Tectomicrobia bacterium]